MAHLSVLFEAPPLTVSLLAAAGCSSGKWQVLCTGKKEILFGSTEILVIPHLFNPPLL